MADCMKQIRLISLTLALSVLSACFGGPDRTCEEVRLYQLAEEGRRLQTPEDLDELNELREIPLPQASPRGPRPEGSPCLDLPPNILGEG